MHLINCQLKQEFYQKIHFKVCYQNIEIYKLNNILEIDEEIFLLTKNLFDLRLKRSTGQNIKPHLFKHTKRRIAQLNLKKSVLLKLLTKI